MKTRNKQHVWLALVLSPVVIDSKFAFAAFEYQGQNTFTLEHYDVDGDLSRGIYPYEGWHRYDDLSLYFSDSGLLYENSPYETMRGYVQASSNHSEYRGQHASNLNSAAMHYENGEFSLPIRLDVGDFFASQSRRTLQRGLKGIQLEFQPKSLPSSQSIQLFWGRSAQNYDSFFDEKKDYFFGGSWLVDTAKAGSFALTSVGYNDGSDQDNENVTSLAWEKGFSAFSFNHTLEAEFAYLTGENTANSDLNGHSKFVHLSGIGDAGKNYLLSFEHNNKEFTPTGAALSPDRESIDIQWGQYFCKRMNMLLRGQRYRDSLSTSNPQTTKLYGVNIVGLPFRNYPLNVNADLSFREFGNKDDTLDQDFLSFNLNLAMPINQQWRNRMAYQWQEQDNQASGDVSHRQFISVGADYSNELKGWKTVVSPNLNYSEDLDASDEVASNLSLGLVLNAEKNGHSLLVSHQRVQFKSEASQGIDSDIAQSRIQWRSQWQAHTLGVDLDWYAYDRDLESAVDSYKMSFAWTYKFQKPKSITPPIIRKMQTIDTFEFLDDLKLNQFYDTSLGTELSNAGWRNAGQSGAYDMFEGQLISAISNRQVLALEKSSSAINSANVLVAFTGSDAVSTKREYEAVLDELLKMYGAPIRERSVGTFDNNWHTRLNDNKLIRIVEWQTESGVLRYGIPRPKAGDIRMEIQLKPKHSSLNDNDWGVSLGL